jgi:vacuolar-type H+-ATPase subunit H
VLHRGEILEILDGARAALPNDLDAARKILSSRDSLIEEGRTSAEALIASAREEVSRMIEQTAIVSAAREEAQHILDDAHFEADAEREEVEKYIDSRLATLEVILNKTSDAVARGRERLAGAGDKDVLSQLANDK